LAAVAWVAATAAGAQTAIDPDRLAAVLDVARDYAREQVLVQACVRLQLGAKGAEVIAEGYASDVREAHRILQSHGASDQQISQFDSILAANFVPREAGDPTLVRECTDGHVIDLAQMGAYINLQREIPRVLDRR
jgi:hypothetical protein